VKYWLFSVTEENWSVIKDSNVFGVPEDSKAKYAVNPGDTLIFYVKKEGAKSLGGMIVGAYKALSTWYREDRLLWPDEVKEGKVKYPWRVKIEPVKVGIVSFEELVPKLSFVGNKGRAHAYLVGTPANLRRPIPEEDYKIIIESLR